MLRLIKVLFFSLITAAAIYVVSDLIFVNLSHFTDFSFVEKFAAKTVFEKTGMKLSLKDFKIKPLHNFNAEVFAREISLTNKNSSVLFAQNTKAKVYLLPVIFGKLKISDIGISKLNADILKLPVMPRKKFPLTLDAEIPELEDFNVCADKLFVLKGKSDKSGTLEGTISSDKNIASFGISKKGGNLYEGYVKNADLKVTEPLLTFFPFISNSAGNINLVFDFMKIGKEKYVINFDGNMTDILVNSDNPYEKISIFGKNTVKAGIITDFKDITFSGFRLNGEGLDIYADGEIENLNNPKLNIKAKVKHTRAEKVVDLLPGVVPEIRKVKYYGISGLADGSAVIKGKIPNPEVVGEVKATDVHALRGEEKSHVGEVSLKFKKTRIFTDLFVKASNGATFKMNGNSEMKKNGESSFEMETTGNMPLDLVSKILTPVADIFELRLGPVPFIKISKGFGKAKLSVEGTKKLAYVDGFVNIENAKGTYEGIGADLSEVSGDVVFKHDTIEFFTKKAKADNTYAQLTGNVSIPESKMKMEISSANVYSADARNIVFSSPLLKDVKEPLKDITALSGKSKLKVTIWGKFNPELPANSPEALQNLKTAGSFEMIDNTCALSYFDGHIENITGIINFTEKTVDFKNVNLKIGNSLFNVSGKTAAPENSKLMKGDVKITAGNADVNSSVIAASNTHIKGYEFVAKNFSYFKDLYGKYDADIDIKIKNSKPDFSQMNVLLTFKPFFTDKNRLVLSSGNIKIKNEFAVLNNLKLGNGTSEIKVEGSLQNIYKPEKYKIWASAENFDVKYLHKSALAGILGYDAQKIAKRFVSAKGKIFGSVKLADTSDEGSIKVKDFEIVCANPKIPVNFSDFSLNVKNSVITLKNIKADVGQTFPVTGNFIVSGYKSVPFVSGNLKLSPSSEFVEKYINPVLDYPVRITGKPDVTVDLNGKTNNLNAKILTTFDKGDDISFYSANIGNSGKERQISLNIVLTPETIDIKDYKFSKSSENKNFVTYLYGSAFLKKFGNLYKPLRASVKTNGRVSAGLLNILFKKSLIKSGDFECSMNLNNGASTPINGSFRAYDISVPLYETFLKTLKISSDKNTINVHTEAKYFESDFELFAKIANKMSLPVKINSLNVNAHGVQNLEKIADGMYKMSIDAYGNKTLKDAARFNISDFVINSGEIKSDNSVFKTTSLKNISVKFNLDGSSVLRLKSNDFEMADGKVGFTGKYDFKNGKASAEIKAYNVNSDKIAETFFNLKGQMEGKLNGHALLSTKGFEQPERLKNLNGTVDFSVKEGKMTRLGSLEYLLRAANIVSSGLTALSVHNAIALLTPVNKGEFSKITGNFDIKNGILRDIEIYSAGTHLSTFIEGTYDFANDECDIGIYGKFGKKVSGILGPVGDMSLNAFFNLIPFIGNENKKEYEQFVRKIPDVTYKGNDYRIFEAEVNGSINDTGSVKSFKWVK